tara:strand:- start:197 stop:517 length:321 start_codon:yes stop_codon:yes gene_type:complete
MDNITNMTNVAMAEFMALYNITDLSALSDLDPKCFDDYAVVILGMCLFVSEILPFYKKYCKDDKTSSEIETINSNEPIIERQGSLMQEADGILHLGMKLYEKFKKK